MKSEVNFAIRCDDDSLYRIDPKYNVCQTQNYNNLWPAIEHMRT